MARPRRTCAALGAIALVSALGAGCRNDMQDQPRYEVNSPSSFFPDGRANRPLVEGVVAHRAKHESTEFETGKGSDGEPVTVLPVPLTRELLLRGQERFGIYCSPCHGSVGDGSGMIVQRGYRRPESFHSQRLREAPIGYLFEAITQGFGVMPSYAAQVPVSDRWAIASYVRALQLSQHAPLADLSPNDRARLTAANAPGEAVHP